jgi:membrane-associated protease RseP (regulator of RpoE activity)
MPFLNLALFLATLLTTTMQGALERHGYASMFPLQDGLSFSLPLMAILLCHEMGHYLAARRHHVPASLPYFVPLPPGIGLFGTMGAVILQSRTSDRRKLIDIGAAGPLAGLLVAIPVLIYGLSISPVQPLVGVGVQEGNSILYAVLKRILHGAWLPGGGRDVMLHPTAMAGWAGLLVTMLNLLPVGQLDGGHVAIAYFGNRYGRASRILQNLLPVFALGVGVAVYLDAVAELARLGGGLSVSPVNIATSAGMPWLMWFVLLALLRRLSGGIDHPPVDDRPLPASRAGLFWLVFVTFAIIFMPVPLRASLGATGDGPNRVIQPNPP